MCSTRMNNNNIIISSVPINITTEDAGILLCWNFAWMLLHPQDAGISSKLFFFFFFIESLTVAKYCKLLKWKKKSKSAERCET